jgi:hypothetical protein
MPVASIKFEMANNTIPVAHLVVDPSKEAAGATPTPNENALLPKAPTLASLSDMYKTLQTKVNLKTVLVSVTGDIACNSDKQKLQLALWRLTGVGIAGLSASGSFSLTLTITHPAYDATKGGCWLPNHEDIAKVPDELLNRQTDPLVGFVEACSAYLAKAKNGVDDANNGEFGSEGESAGTDPTLKELTDVILPSAEAAVFALALNTAWYKADGEDVPFASSSATASQVAAIMGRAYWPYTGRPSMSVWDVFTSIVCPAFEITVNGDPSGNQLVVTPFAPWGKPVAVIYDDEIADISLPSEDADPLAAVLASYHDSTMEADWGIYVAAVTGTGEAGATVKEITQGGGFLEPLKQGILGKIMVLNPPAWARDFLKYRAALVGEGEDSVYPLDAGIYISAINSAASDSTPAAANPNREDYTTYRKLLNVWCRQAFYRGYRYSMGVTMRVRLMITNPEFKNVPGQYLRPGITIEVRSRSADETIFYFYISAVTHVMDSQNAQAYTTVQGSYLRADEQILDTVLSEEQLVNGIENALYGSTGDIGNKRQTAAAQNTTNLVIAQ